CARSRKASGCEDRREPQPLKGYQMRALLPGWSFPRWAVLMWIVTNASILFSVALVICGASSSVGAQSELPATPAQQPAQGNSRVSLEDFTRSAESTATFRRLDKNNNGRISFDEWKKFDSTPDARKHFDSLLSAGKDQITPNGWKYRLPKSGI